MLLFDFAQGALVAVLLVSVIGKVLSAARGRAAWPEGPNFFSLHIPMSLVIVCEIIVIIAYLSPWLISPSWSGVANALLYSCFAIATGTLRGRSCACFGTQGKPIGRIRIGLGWTVATVAWVAALLPSTIVSALPRLTVVMAITLAIGAAMGTAIFLRKKRFAQASQAEGSNHYLILSPGCAACTAVQRLLAGVNLPEYGITVLNKAEEEDRVAAAALAPESPTPAFVVETRDGEVDQIVTGAGPCYDQIQQMKQVPRVAH